MFLKGGLHTDVPFRGYIMGRYKDLANILGYFFYMLDAPFKGNGVHQL